MELPNTTKLEDNIVFEKILLSMKYIVLAKSKTTITITNETIEDIKLNTTAYTEKRSVNKIEVIYRTQENTFQPYSCQQTNFQNTYSLRVCLPKYIRNTYAYQK